MNPDRDQQPVPDDVVSHFVARAPTYDRSSAWCTDDRLGALIVGSAGVDTASRVLDVACGTGLVARHFKGQVARVTGLDANPAMADQASPYLDECVIAPAEKMPFAAGSFDATVCRQGIQFMRLPAAIEEMARVTRPGGRVVLANLCAYDDTDREEYFEILRLRNPARRHFFLPDDLGALLANAGCRDVELHRHVSVEDVDGWSDHGAIDEDRREAIRRAYRAASAGFRRLHASPTAEGRIADRMLFVVATGIKV